MHILHINQIAVNFIGREIFRDLTWVLGDTDRIGLVGPNGAGKSTLLKAIFGEVELEAGNITRQNGIRVGYLEQDVHLVSGGTLIDEAMILPDVLREVDEELDQIEALLIDEEVYSDDLRLTRVLEQQDDALRRYERMNGHRHASHVRELLAMLGFTQADYDLPIDALSGGQKKLVALVKLAVSAPDILLLDEPDNHLDLEGKRHLERFVHQYRGSVVMVSHDRYLLDEIATQIAELDDGKIEVYPGNYTAYTTERELRRLRQQQLYVAQQKEIARIEAAIARFELWASMVIDERHIKQARSRRKMLDRMEERGEIIEKVVDARKMNLKLDGWRGSKKMVELESVSMAFDDNPIFFDVDMLIGHGDRVGLIGPNGAGKSVLFKLILGEYEPLDGIIKVGPSVRIGYYSQEHQTLSQFLDKTPVEMVRQMRVGSETSAVHFLMRMLFSYDQMRQPIRTMSGGERSRLQLALLMINEPNLLLLDEPTNNLDIPSVEVLEEALEDFEGAILTISHDRYFLDRVVDRVLALEDGALTEFLGGYTDYLSATGKS